MSRYPFQETEAKWQRIWQERGTFAARLERVLASQGSQITFGWAVFPSDGENALSLYRAADERLYARKLVRLEQPEASGVVPLGA